MTVVQNQSNFMMNNVTDETILCKTFDFLIVFLKNCYLKNSFGQLSLQKLIGKKNVVNTKIKNIKSDRVFD